MDTLFCTRSTIRNWGPKPKGCLTFCLSSLHDSVVWGVLSPPPYLAIRKLAGAVPRWKGAVCSTAKKAPAFPRLGRSAALGPSLES
jgi:hypothetical protein